MQDIRPRITSLDGIVDSVLEMHTDRLKPARSRMMIRGQGILPHIDIDTTGSYRAVAMGRFYEHLTAALYGGKLGNRIEIDQATNGDDSNGNGEVVGGEKMDITTIMKPDVVHSEGNVLYESKACRSGQKCNLTDFQVRLYKELQQRSPYPKVYFVVYRHGLYGIKSSWTGSAEGLFRALSERTAYSLVLPLRLILRLHDPENLSRWVSRYEGKETSRDDFNTCTSIMASALTKLLKEPEEVLQDLDHQELSFHHREFSVRRFMSPSRLYINRCRIQKFPIVYIIDNVAEGESESESDIPF